ncbi:MAG: ABC transporter permease [Clostridiales bacterium]|nr:ABC transporter permease [Clostridiales bacterium]
MRTLGYLIGRNTKLFFKDKGTLFTAMVAPLILLLLFITFLGKVYEDSFHSSVPSNIDVPESIIDGFVGGWLFSSLLAVCCVTVAFSANMIMVQDKVTGARDDITIAPVKRSVIGLSYYVSTALITGIICYITTAVGFIYLSQVGWYLSTQDALLVIVDVFIMVLFGTAFSSLVCFFLTSQGGIAAVSTIISAAYGFVCGAYMPIAQFSESIQNFITCLPGTYGTVLLHKHLMGGSLMEMEEEYFPKEVVDVIKDGFDNNLYFMDNKVEIWQMYLVLVGTIVILVGLYVIFNILKKRG